jgi:hypothetical protein
MLDFVSSRAGGVWAGLPVAKKWQLSDDKSLLKTGTQPVGKGNIGVNTYDPLFGPALVEALLFMRPTFFRP